MSLKYARINISNLFILRLYSYINMSETYYIYDAEKIRHIQINIIKITAI